jgi:cytoskeletal protein RodZ
MRAVAKFATSLLLAMPDIGETLRDARMRARIDVSEMEAQTKIRAKYLRALENEEWSLLPGATFVKSFLRTYAQALGLDGRALVEEYRKSYEAPGEGTGEPIVASPARARARRSPPRPSRGYAIAIGAISLVIVALIVALLSGGGSPKRPSTSASSTNHARGHRSSAGHRSSTSARRSSAITVSLRATGTVYVCLVGDGRKLIPGTSLQAGASTPTFKARHFKLTLGNNAVTLLIDGTPRSVPASSQAIGYSITKAGRRTLAPEQMPTCA